MQNLDFTSMMKKYPLLASRDVSFLNDFFNSEEAQKILTEIEIQKKKRINFRLKIGVVWFISSILYVIITKLYTDIGLVIISFLVSFLIFFIIGAIAAYFIFKNSKTIKGDLLPMFVRKINDNIEYSESSGLFSDTLSKLRSIDLLDNYDRLDFMEDSIKYVIGKEHNKVGIFSNEIVPEGEENIVITGCEIKTSKEKRRHTKNGTQTYYVTNNHCYIMKIDFKNPRFTLKKPIKLLEDINDNILKKSLHVFGIQLTCFIPLGFITSDEPGGGLGGRIVSTALHYPFITTTFLIGMYVSIWFIYSYIKGNKRVKLENIEFEKKFDVYCDDQIESRKLLTPSFMYRLVDYVNKISEERIYEMYFHKNIFYVKFDILRSKGKSNYMEISKWKNVFKNLEDYVEFYLELKNITSLTRDLKLFYYDKGLMSSKVIK